MEYKVVVTIDKVIRRRKMFFVFQRIKTPPDFKKFYSQLDG